MIKLHLGCGARRIPGWIHVDAVDRPNVDMVQDIRSLHRFPDESVSIIYACTVLEHFSMAETNGVLIEWRRALCPGGILRLSVPDFRVLSKIYLEGYPPNIEPGNLELIKGMVVGGQRDRYDYHKNVFDERRLTTTLLAAGFTAVRPWDWRKTEHAGIDDYSRAYLPHMDFEHGINTSLNLEAVK